MHSRWFLAAGLALASSAPLAQTACGGGSLSAPIFDSLKALPLGKVPELQATWQKTIADLRDAAKKDDSGYCVAESGKVRLFYTLSPDDQAAHVTYDGTFGIPQGSGNPFGDAQLANPIFSLSLSGSPIVVSALPASSRLAEFLRAKHPGLQSLTVDVGVQVFGRASLSGAIYNLVLRDTLKMPLDRGVWLRAGQSAEMPEWVGAGKTAVTAQTRSSVRGSFVERTKAFAEGRDSVAGAGTEGSMALFLEIRQLPENNSWSGMLGVSEITASDATVYLSRSPELRFAGNLTFASANRKTFPTYLVMPFKSGKPDADKLVMGLSAPAKLTLAEFTSVMVALSAEASPIGMTLNQAMGPKYKGVVRNLQKLAKPLGFIAVNRNPPGQVPFKAGGAVPPVNSFNYFFVGKEAKDPEENKGPVVRIRGGLSVFGAELASTDSRLADGRFVSNSRGAAAVDLSAVGLARPNASLTAAIDINDSPMPEGQSIKFVATTPDRTVDFKLDETHVAIESPPSCLMPLGLSGRVGLDAFSFGSIGGAIKSVSADPAKPLTCSADVVCNAARKAGGAAGSTSEYLVNGSCDGAAKGIDFASGLARQGFSAGANVGKDGARLGASMASDGVNAGRELSRDLGRFAQKAGEFVGGVFRGDFNGNSLDQQLEKECNWRPQALIDRNNNFPSIPAIDAFTASVFTPLQNTSGRAKAIREHLQRETAQWRAAHEGIRTLRTRWNQLSDAKNDLAKSFNEYHAAEGPLPPGLGVRPLSTQNVAIAGTADLPATLADVERVLNLGNLEFSQWVAMKELQDPNWRPSRYTMTLLKRCAEAHVANIPVRMAGRWGVPVIRSNPGDPGSAIAERMNGADYRKLKADLHGFVMARSGQVDVYERWMADFSAAWVYRNGVFLSDLRQKMLLDPRTLYFVDAPDTKAQFAPLWKEYLDALSALRAQANRLLNTREPLPSQAELSGTIERIVRAMKAYNDAVAAAKK